LDNPFDLGFSKVDQRFLHPALSARINSTINIETENYMMEDFGTQPITATNILQSARLLE
jgi:hypothetical protein